MRYLKSIFIWTGIVCLILVWLPLLSIMALFDRDPVRYKTGKMFRGLGWAISRINPNWIIHIEGNKNIDDRKPYVIVCNHLSNADIPLISNLPWEMKWVAKKELFDIPIVGWMMKLAKDISVDRKRKVKKEVFEKCSFALEHNTSVMFFPEGTRSKTGMLNRFSFGAFDLAIRKQIDILPLVIDGTQGCLPKRSWTFSQNDDIRLKILNPVDVSDYSVDDIRKLTNDVRSSIANQLAEWRDEPIHKVDAMSSVSPVDDVSG